MGLNSVQKPDKISGVMFDKNTMNKVFEGANNLKNAIRKPVKNYTSDDIENLNLNFGGIRDLGFVKYDTLSDEELSKITRLCSQEQGSTSLEGIAAEASQMANYFEVNWNGNYKGLEGAAGLYDCIKNSGYWENSVSVMENGSKENPPTKEGEKIVKKVLVDGMRTLPKYVTQHAAKYSLSSVVNNGVAMNKDNNDNYIPHISKVVESSSSFSEPATWIFYSFPTEGSDPFGYNSESIRKKYSDDHYNFRDLGLKLSSDIKSSN